MRRLSFSLVALALTLVGCDSETVSPPGVTFGGVTYEAVGGASLSVSGEGLVVGGGGGGEYGVRVSPEGAFQAADVQTLPVDLDASARWGLQLFGEAGGTRVPLASAWNDALTDSTHEVVIDFDAVTGATTMRVEYYNLGELVFVNDRVPLDPDGQQRRRATVGSGSGKAGSVHVIRDGSRWIVATDFGGGEPRVGAGGCAGMTISVAGTAPFCTDYIQAIPNAFSGEVTDFEVRGRALDAFTITGGDVD